MPKDDSILEPLHDYNSKYKGLFRENATKFFDSLTKESKINVDENMDLAQLFGVVSIPMLAVIKNGKMVNQTVGLTGKEEILKMLEG